MQRIFLFLSCLVALFALTATASAAGHAKHPAPGAQSDDAKSDDAKTDDSKADDTKDDAVSASANEAHGPVTMTVGVMVLELNKFDLAQGTYQTEFLATVHCDREPCKPDLDVANGKITGKPEKLHDETLFKIFKMKAELSAVIDLSSYPFDNHALPIVLEDRSDPEEVTFELDKDRSGVKDDIKLPGWDVTQWAATIEKDDVGDGTKISQIHFAIEAQRPTMMATFKSIVPVAIMIFVAAFTLLLKPKSAAGRLGTATGGLMSIVMFQVGQVGSLPPIGYLTRLDKFMIATYLVYLVNIGLSVAMVRFEDKKKEKHSELAYLVAAGAVPGVALIAWAAVFMKLV
jgi:hypothetical protein